MIHWPELGPIPNPEPLIGNEWDYPSTSGSQLGVSLPPRGHLAMSRDIWLSQRGQCYWHLAGRGQGCWEASYNAQDSPPQQRIMAQDVNNAKVGKPCLRLIRATPGLGSISPLTHRISQVDRGRMHTGAQPQSLPARLPGPQVTPWASLPP